MLVWRISKFTDVSGRGGLAASGRWHTRPKSIIYCSDEPRTAYEEIVRQVGHASLMPEDAKLLKIEIPDHLKIAEITAESLPADWQERPPEGWAVCQPLGDAWFETSPYAVLKVPSSARAGHVNYLVKSAAREADDIVLRSVIDLASGPDVLGDDRMSGA